MEPGERFGSLSVAMIMEMLTYLWQGIVWLVLIFLIEIPNVVRTLHRMSSLILKTLCGQIVVYLHWNGTLFPHWLALKCR